MLFGGARDTLVGWPAGGLASGNADGVNVYIGERIEDPMYYLHMRGNCSTVKPVVVR